MFKEETVTIQPTFDAVKIQMIHTEATSAAKAAVQKMLDDWRAKTGGNEYGEPMYCGFAWVDVKVRSNSKLGKALQSVGFKKSWQSGYLRSEERRVGKECRIGCR